MRGARRRRPRARLLWARYRLVCGEILNRFLLIYFWNTQSFTYSFVGGVRHHGRPCGGLKPPL
jgi:hypothetical protein